MFAQRLSGRRAACVASTRSIDSFSDHGRPLRRRAGGPVPRHRARGSIGSTAGVIGGRPPGRTAAAGRGSSVAEQDAAPAGRGVDDGDQRGDRDEQHRAGNGAGIGAGAAEDRRAAEHDGGDRGEQIGIADADIALAVHAEHEHAGETGGEAADAHRRSVVVAATGTPDSRAGERIGADGEEAGAERRAHASRTARSPTRRATG